MGDERPAKRRMISHEPSSDVAPTLGSLASQNGNAGQDTVMEQAAPVESEPGKYRTYLRSMFTED